MNTRRNTIALLLLFSSFQLASIQAESPVPPLLSGTRHSSCHHVINLLLNYGIQTHAQLPNVDSVLLGESIGDLVLTQVAMLDSGSAAAGPTVAVTLRNDSRREVKAFSVTAVAVFVRIDPWSPSVTQRVTCIAPGEAIELHLRLPLESLAMGQVESESLAFRKLVVAIDSFDELVESSESNNLLVLDRGKIPVLAPAVEVDAPAAGAEPQVVNPPVKSTPAVPMDPTQTPRKKIEDIDLDELGIDD